MRNIGIQDGLIERKHVARMGQARWLFDWLVNRQTGIRGCQGLVWYGKPITYATITAQTKIPRRTLQRWMKQLRQAHYIRTELDRNGLIIRIEKQKKWGKWKTRGRAVH